MKNIAIIPARGSSKRVPKKNIKPFLGKPIISYVINSALESELFEEVMVSTDDQEIMQIALSCGAKVPFIRSAKNSDDFATTADVLSEVINKYLSLDMKFDNLCCIYPTAVFASSEKIKLAYEILINNSYHSVMPIVRYSTSILRSLKRDNSTLSFAFPEYRLTRSQDLPSYYFDPGLFYWLKIDHFLKEGEIIGLNTGGLEVSEIESQDIDDKLDWQLAELKYKTLHISTKDGV